MTLQQALCNIFSAQVIITKAVIQLIIHQNQQLLRHGGGQAYDRNIKLEQDLTSLIEQLMLNKEVIKRSEF